jgi:hypothetical protein
MGVCRVEQHLTDSKTTGNKKDVRSNKKVPFQQDKEDQDPNHADPPSPQTSV